MTKRCASSKCYECALSSYAHDWRDTWCRGTTMMTEEQVLEMYHGCHDDNGNAIYPKWCPIMQRVYVKY